MNCQKMFSFKTEIPVLKTKTAQDTKFDMKMQLFPKWKLALLSQQKMGCQEPLKLHQKSQVTIFLNHIFKLDSEAL